jgi:hypothetical protein
MPEKRRFGQREASCGHLLVKKNKELKKRTNGDANSPGIVILLPGI